VNIKFHENPQILDLFWETGGDIRVYFV